MAPQVQVLTINVALSASSIISAKEVAIHDTDVSFPPEAELSGEISVRVVNSKNPRF